MSKQKALPLYDQRFDVAANAARPNSTAAYGSHPIWAAALSTEAQRDNFVACYRYTGQFSHVLDSH